MFYYIFASRSKSKIYGTINLQSKTNYATVDSYQIANDSENLISSFIRILTNSIKLLKIDINSIKPSNDIQNQWICLLKQTLNNQDISLNNFIKNFYNVFNPNNFSTIIQQIILSLPEELENMFNTTYQCPQCKKEFTIFTTSLQAPLCDKCNISTIMLNQSAIQLQFIQPQQSILPKTFIYDTNYVLYSLLSCKNEHPELRFYQVLVDFNYLDAEQMYILSRPKFCNLTEKIDPLTYLKGNKINIYLQNQSNNSVQRQIGACQLVMYFNYNLLTGLARENVQQQFDITKTIAKTKQLVLSPEPIEEQPVEIKPIDIPKPKQKLQSPLLQLNEPLVAPVLINNVGILAVMLYIMSIILLLISMILMAIGISKVTNNYKPNSLIVKDSLIYESQNQEIQSNNQIRYKQNTQQYSNSFVIDKVQFDYLTLNNTNISSFTDNKTCSSISINPTNMQTSKNINVQARTANISVLQSEISVIQSMNAKIDELATTNLTANSLNTTKITVMENQINCQNLSVSLAQTMTLESPIILSNGNTIASNSTINNMNSQIFGSDNLNVQKITATGKVDITSTTTDLADIKCNADQITLTGNVTIDGQINSTTGTVTRNSLVDTLQVSNKLTSDELDIQEEYNSKNITSQISQFTNISSLDSSMNTSNITLANVSQQIKTEQMEVNQEGNITVTKIIDNLTLGNFNFEKQASQIEMSQISANVTQLNLYATKITANSIQSNETQSATYINVTSDLSSNQDAIIESTTGEDVETNDLTINTSATLTNAVAEKYNINGQEFIKFSLTDGVIMETDINQAERYTVDGGKIEECM